MKIDLTMKSYIFCFITIALWSTFEVVSKQITGAVSPYSITALRFLIGALVLSPFAIYQYKKQNRKIGLKDVLRLSVPGILNVTLAMQFLQFAVHYGKASLSAIIISSTPIFIAIFAWIILKERPSLLRSIGVLLGLVGLGLIIFGENMELSTALNLPLGIGFGLGAAIFLSLSTVISKKYVQEYGSLMMNVISFIMGALVLIIYALLSGESLQFELNAGNVLPILYLGTIVTGFAYVIFYEGLKNISVTSGSMFFFLKPVIASFLAYIFLHEHLTLLQIGGIIVILLGIGLEKIKFGNVKRMVD